MLARDEAQTALSFRNIPKVNVLPAEAVGVADLVGAGRLLVSAAAVDELVARAGGAAAASEEVS